MRWWICDGSGIIITYCLVRPSVRYLSPTEVPQKTPATLAETCARRPIFAFCDTQPKQLAKLISVRRLNA